MPPKIPKLKKNRTQELRWGQQYWSALKDAVFTIKNDSDLDVGKLQSGNNQPLKKIHNCEQCGDSFYFQQSLDEHTARYSWILGYWCQYCVHVNCDHKAGRDMCQVCLTTQKKKCNYLRARGLKRGHKPAKITLFYNQCKFFDHLSQHGVSTVDMADIMLMPLPHNISTNEYAALDFVCKALMECMFMKRIHIMDWLRLRNVDFKWWNCKPDENNSVSELLKMYSPDGLLANDCTVEAEKEAPVSEDSTSEFFQPRKSISAYGEVTEKNIPKVSPEDNYSEILIDTDNSLNCSTSQDSESVIVEDVDPLKEDFDVQELDNSKIHSSLDGTKEIDGQLTINILGNSVKVLDITKPIHSPSITVKTPAQLGATGFFDSPKKEEELSSNIKISSKNLPPLNMNNKILRIISSEPLKRENSRGSKKIYLPNIPGSIILNVETNKIIPINLPTTIGTKNSVESTNSHISTDREIVLPSGAKNIVEKNADQLQIVPSNSANPVEVDEHLQPFKIQTPNTSNFQSMTKANLKDPSFLLYWRSVDRHSPNVTYNCTKQYGAEILWVKIDGEKLFLQRVSVDELYCQRKKINHLSMPEKKVLIEVYRKKLLSEVKQKNYVKAQKIVDDIKMISWNYANAKCADISSILNFNLVSLKVFEKYVSSNEANDTIENKSTDEFDKKLKNWEIDMKEDREQCRKCFKKLLPLSYVPGMSITPKNQLDYCPCSNFICHICLSRQGSLQRYKAHVKLHKKENPFTCPECFVTFPTIHSLEIHIWTRCFHIITQQFYSCTICAIKGFLTIEDLARHYARVHAKLAVICPQCHLILNSFASYKEHFALEHTAVVIVRDPERLIICDLGQCLVRPENLCLHLERHQELGREHYFTCPFCSFALRNTHSNREKIQQHVFHTHTLRLREVITRDTLLYFIKHYKLAIPAAHMYVPIAPADESNIVIPKIVNTCSIAQTAFERVSSGDDGLKFDISAVGSEKINEINQSKYPSIINVSFNEIDGVIKEKNDEDIQLIPRIVNVVSGNDVTDSMDEILVEDVAQNLDEILMPVTELKKNMINDNQASEIPDITKYTEISIVKVDSDLIKNSNITENIEKDQFSLGNLAIDDFTAKEKDDSPVNNVLECELVEKNSDSLINSNINKLDGQTLGQVPKNIMTNIQLSLRRKRTRRKPWRIALNSPNNSTVSSMNYKCHLCGEIINTSWSIIKNHFTHCHAGDYKVSIITPCIPRMEKIKIKSKNDGKKRKNDFNSTTPKKRRRIVNKKIVEKKYSRNLGICVTQESLQDIEGHFKCKKCHELFDNVDILRQHVATSHRIRQHFLVCLECGENFIVSPSLQMHLKAFHGINDPIAYLEQHTEYAPDIIDEFDETITESNQCHVCRAVFEDKATVDKHLRVHGMAFLNRKRIEARNALKSPEKNAQLSNSSPQKSNEESPKKDLTNCDKHLDCDKDNDSLSDRITSV